MNAFIEPAVRAIAFHLPQFHPIPENDSWWGKGFTEWNNVAKAKPLFPGHYQPHLPADLGFYDLRLSEAHCAQADLARQYGIHGFCYYHYWFNGKLLLEKPLHRMLESGKPEFPFCLCWANESWTRAWDGRTGNVLVEQKYSHEDDIRHIEYLLSFFSDERYIRIGNKPLFLVYRASDMPDALRTTETWRKEAKSRGLGELFLCRVESFPNDRSDPKSLGFDAAIEFQPDWMNLGRKLDSEAYGDHAVFDYEDVALRMMMKDAPSYKRFPCVTPSWDNSPRRKKNATIFLKFSPQSYETWLFWALTKLLKNQPDEKLVFINAWNEWGEGNHLEPDQKYGTAFLEATKNALDNLAEMSGSNLMLKMLAEYEKTGQEELLKRFAKRYVERYSFHRSSPIKVSEGDLQPEIETMVTMPEILQQDLNIQQLLTELEKCQRQLLSMSLKSPGRLTCLKSRITKLFKK